MSVPAETCAFAATNVRQRRIGAWFALSDAADGDRGPSRAVRGHLRGEDSLFVAHHQPEVPAFSHARGRHSAPRLDGAAAARDVARQVALVAELSEVARTYSFAAVIRFKCRLVLPAHLGHLKRTKEVGLYAAIHRRQQTLSRGLENFIERGFGPLHLAALHGLREVVLRLLRAGADPDLRDTLNRTPREIAVMRGFIDVAAEFVPVAPGAGASMARFLRDRG